MYELTFTPQADSDLREMEDDPSKKNILKAVRKTLGFMETNLRHPSLNTHEFTSLKGPNGEKVFEVPIPLIPAGCSDGLRPLIPIHSGHPYRSEATLVFIVFLHKYHFGSSFSFFLIEPPFMLIRWALWMRRSRMASAMVGSPIFSCQFSRGN